MSDTRDVSERIDWRLNYLFAAWSQLPVIAEEWDTWESIDQNVFDMEWTIKQDALNELQRFYSQGLFSSRQCERYAELQCLMEQNAPILERLLAA